MLKYDLSEMTEAQRQYITDDMLNNIERELLSRLQYIVMYIDDFNNEGDFSELFCKINYLFIATSCNVHKIVQFQIDRSDFKYYCKYDGGFDAV